MVNIALLNAEMEDLGISKAVLARKCNFTRITLYNKLGNPKSITADDAYRIADALRIPRGSQKFLDIFFAPEVSETET